MEGGHDYQSLPVQLHGLLLEVHAALTAEHGRSDQVLQDVCDRLAAVMGYPLVWAALVAAGGDLEILAAAGSLAEPRRLCGIVLPQPRSKRGEAQPFKCLASGQPLLVKQAVAELPIALPPGPLLLVPIKSPQASMGVIGALGRPDHPFPPVEQFLLELTAGHTACTLNMLQRCTSAAETANRLKLAATVFDHALEGIFITDPDARILAANPAACRITGYGERELLGQTPRLFRSGRQTPEFYAAFWQELKSRGCWHGEIWNRRKNGDVFPEILSVSAIRDSAGAIVQYVALLVDISAQKTVEAQLQYKAHHDELTGLSNRVQFKEYLARSLAHARRESFKLAVLFIDLDHFKYINDTLGHQMGDALLQAVAERIRGYLREEDLVARLGGDEFAVLLLGITHLQDAARVAKKLIDALTEPVALDNHELSITASIGIAVYPEDGDSMDDLLRRADNAMYSAKDLGRNTVQFYRSEMDTRSRERMSISNALQRALDRDEFFLVYQPQIDLRTDRVVGVEALLRWRHGDDVITPGRFIPVAEETSLIVRIGQWVLHTACLQGRRWQDSGAGSFRVAVNLSARQFLEKGLLSAIHGVLEVTGFPALQLELEITESLAMANVARTSQVLWSMKGMGVGISIDDFGTGYSSLAYLGEYPLDTLKIDLSFVHGIGRNPRQEAIIRAVIAMAGTLGLGLVAEGVETEQQLQFLQDNGCHVVQGYYLAQPMVAEDFGAWLLARGESAG
jgi:diguanylate cyclase (GGDEF)-like protein/PAS domain S-box-containing protein